MVVLRFDVFLANLDPTVGSEIKKTRPCLIISPDEMNQNLNTDIAAPIITIKRNYPTRINLTFNKKSGQIVLVQIRSIDKIRLVKNIGSIKKQTSDEVFAVLHEVFSP